MTEPNDAELQRLRARIAELEALLTKSGRTIEAVFKLPPALSKLMGLMLAVPHVNERMICEQLDIATVGKVAVWRLRNALAEHKLEIHSKRTIGWWFDDETKSRIKQMLDGEVTPAVTEAAA